MADEIDMSNGRANIVYAGAKPWHKLGLSVPDLMLPAEAVIGGGLDFAVDLHQSFVNIDNTQVEIPDSFATVRRDTKKVLGRVGGRYKPIQNCEAAAFVEMMFPGSRCVETAGSLFGGQRCWFLLKLPEVTEPVPGDPVEQYILVVWSHDGSITFSAMFNPIRVVCWNTMRASLGSKHSGKVSIRHTKNAVHRMADAVKILDSGRGYFARANEAFSAMAKVNMTSDKVRQILDQTFPGKVEEADAAIFTVKAEIALSSAEVEDAKVAAKRARERILTLFEGEALGSDRAGSTGWGLFNAITQWVDRERPTRGTATEAKVNESRFDSSQFGPGATVRDRSAKAIMALV